MDAIIYCRFSPRPGESCDSNDRQLDACKRAVASREWDLVGAYHDDWSSGKTRDRKGLNLAIAHACRVKGVLVVFSLSRMARSVSDASEISRLLNKHNAYILSVKEGFDTTSSGGRLVLHILAAIAEFEGESISERTSFAHLWKQKNGKRISCTPPYGYVDDPNDPKRFVPCPVQQEHIRTMAELRQKGLSWRAIAREMNARGIPTARNGKAWRGFVIAPILEREGYPTEPGDPTPAAPSSPSGSKT